MRVAALGALRLGLWLLFLFIADWPGIILFAALQCQALICYHKQRRYAIGFSVFGIAAVLSIVGWLLAIGPDEGMYHLLKKIYQRTFHLVSDTQGLAEGRSFSFAELTVRYFQIHSTLIGWSLVLPTIVWAAINAFKRKPARPVAFTLIAFGVVFLAVGAQGHYQHDYWSHPIAAVYALGAALAVCSLRIPLWQTMWLAVIICILNIGVLGNYRGAVTGRTSGPMNAAAHCRIHDLAKVVPETELVAVIDSTHWPTMPFYLERRYVSFSSAKSLSNSNRVPSGNALAWQAYLVTHKILLTNSAAKNARSWINSEDQLQCSWALVRNRERPPALKPFVQNDVWSLCKLTKQINNNAATGVSHQRRPKSGTGELRRTLPATSDEDESKAIDVHLPNPIGVFLLFVTPVLIVGLCRVRRVMRIRIGFLATAFSRLAHQQFLSSLFVGGLGFGFAVSLTLIAGAPIPFIHDEFSYLLGADTFLQGRMTNPIHPLWRHFECIHVLSQPTYCSKYPPAQALFLALGLLITGQAICGVWICMGLASAASHWMFRGWLRPNWALLAGILMALHPWIMLRWGHSYMGGGVAMLGGALLFGGIRHMLLAPKKRCAAAILIGLVLLAVSRPWEGFVVMAAALLLILIRACGSAEFRHRLQLALRQFAWPSLLILAPVIALMGVHNWQATGNPLSLPYFEHEKQYAAAPSFVFQNERSVKPSRHLTIRKVHFEWELWHYRAKQSIAGLAQSYIQKLRMAWDFYLVQGILAIPLVALPFLTRQRWFLFALLVCSLLFAAYSLHTFSAPHYLAPIAPLFIVIVVQCMRYLRTLKIHEREVGRLLFRLILLIFTLCIYNGVMGFRTYHNECRSSASTEQLWQLTRNPHFASVGLAHARDRMSRKLRKMGGGHVVIVRYLADYDCLFDWVYNRAEIDDAPVVWARELDESDNRALIEYYAGRKIWILEAGRGGIALHPFDLPRHFFLTKNESDLFHSHIRNWN